VKRVLLTGATGFIGRHAIAPLIAKGYEVHAVSSRPAARAADAVQWHTADLLDEDAVQRLLAGVRPTHLLHLAWYVEAGLFWTSPENARWLAASLALLQHFREHGGRRAVMAGTCAEYDWSHGVCFESLTPLRPTTPYGSCKNALGEALCRHGVGEGLSTAWGRVFFLYGPGEPAPRLVPSVIRALSLGETARCTHGRQVRDYLHASDAASAFVALLDSAVEGPVNIASGNPVTIREVVLAAAECLGAADRVEFGALPAPANEPSMLVADVRRLSEEVGWRPSIGLADGMGQVVRAWQEAHAK
jgi:nucleoside-diphosphate-sugar epimerase